MGGQPGIQQSSIFHLVSPPTPLTRTLLFHISPKESQLWQLKWISFHGPKFVLGQKKLWRVQQISNHFLDLYQTQDSGYRFFSAVWKIFIIKSSTNVIIIYFLVLSVVVCCRYRLCRSTPRQKIKAGEQNVIPVEQHQVIGSAYKVEIPLCEMSINHHRILLPQQAERVFVPSSHYQRPSIAPMLYAWLTVDCTTDRGPYDLDMLELCVGHKILSVW